MTLTCCLKTDALVGAGPFLMLPLPVVARINWVSSVSTVCVLLFKKLIPLFRPRLFVRFKLDVISFLLLLLEMLDSLQLGEGDDTLNMLSFLEGVPLDPPELFLTGVFGL